MVYSYPSCCYSEREESQACKGNQFSLQPGSALEEELPKVLGHLLQISRESKHMQDSLEKMYWLICGGKKC